MTLTVTAAPRLSIIVPVLNEAAALPDLLSRLQPFLARGCELILVDGGSTDDSRQIARAAGVMVVESVRGRARQLNEGAACARGEVLLFLHADTCLPDHADAEILAALAAKDHIWGRFDVQIEGRSRMLPLVASMMNWRSRWSGIATGDQAMFVIRAKFEAMGGFPQQPLMEDVELSRRLRRLSPPACLRSRVRTSGRRWDRDGPWTTILLMWRLRFAYWLGVPAERLARHYR